MEVNTVRQIIDRLDGKKTYLGGVVIFIAGGLKAINVIDQVAFELLLSFGAAITAGGIRHAVKKLEN